MAKTHEINFKLNLQVHGQFAEALKAAQAQLEALKKISGKTSADAMRQIESLGKKLFALNQQASNAEKFVKLKQTLPAAQAKWQQQQQTTSQLAAKLNQESAAVDALRQKLEALNQARNALKLNIQGNLSNELKNLRDQRVTIQAQLKNFKGNPEDLARLRQQLSEIDAAIKSQNATVAAARAEYKNLGAQAKQAAADLKSAEKNLKLSQGKLNRSRKSSGALKEDYQTQQQELQRARTSLSAQGFSVANFAASERKLRAEIEETIRALERLSQATTAQGRLRETILAAAPEIKKQLQAKRQERVWKEAANNLNANYSGLQRAQNELALRNSQNIITPRKITPSADNLSQVQKLNAKISEGKYFGNGLEKLQQIQQAATLYQKLTDEFKVNRQESGNAALETLQISRQQQKYSATLENLRAELGKYTAAYEANKKNLAPDDARAAAEKIKSITAEITQAEKVLAQLSKNLELSKGNKQNLAAAMHDQLQQLRQLKSVLSGEGFNTSNFAASEAQLRAQIEATTKAMERQAQAQALLDRYAAARKSAQPDIAAIQKADTKVRLANARETILGIAAPIKAQEKFQQWTAAQSSLNRNLNEMLGAWQNLQRLNSVNIPEVKKVTPQLEVSKQVGKITGKLSAGATFASGVEGSKQILEAAQAYKDLTREMIDNRKGYQALNRETLQAQKAYQQQQQAISKLRDELSRYSNAFKSVEKSLSPAAATQAQQNIKAMTAEITQAEKVLAQLAKRLETLGGNRTNFSSAIQAQLQQMRQLQTVLNGAGFSTSNLGNSEMRLRSQIESTTQAMARQAQMAERLSNAQNNFNDAQSNYQVAKDVASSIMSPFTSSVETAKNFEHQMSMVKALSQMDFISKGDTATVEKNMAALTLKAKEEGLRTRYSALDAAKGETYLAYAGWTTPQITAALPSMLDLAASADMSDLGRVADITSDIMMAFKMPAEQAQKMADVLTYTVTHSNQNLEQLYESMKYAAPIAKAFGSSLEETAAMSKFMADAGIKGSMAGTSMRAIMTRLVAPPKTITKTMEENGITLDDANKEWLNANLIAQQELDMRLNENLTAGQQMAAVIRQINKKMAGKTSHEKMAVFKAISGLYAVSGALNLFDTGGEMIDDEENPGQKITKLEDFTRKLERSQGAARQTADVMMDNYAGQLKILNSAIENLQIELGSALTPTLKVVAKFAAEFAQAFAKFNQQHPHIVQGIAAIAAGISALIVTTAGLALSFAAFEFGAAQIAMFRAGLAGAEIATAGFAARLGMLARAFKGLAIWGTLAPFLKFGGWGKIGAGIAGAFAGLRTLGLAGIGAALGTKIVSGAVAAATAIKGIATAFRVATVASLSFIASPIGLALAALAVAAYAVYQKWGAISPVFESLAQTLSARVAPAVDAMINSFDGAAKAWAKLFNIDTDGATDLLVRGFIAAAKIISQVMLAIVHFVANSVAALADLFGALGDAINAALNRDPQALKAAAAKMGDFAKHSYSALVEPARDILAIPEDLSKAKSFYFQNKKADRIAKNSNAVTKVDRMTNEIYIAAKKDAAARHALKYNEETKTLHSQKLTAEDIRVRAETIKTAEIQRKTAEIQKQISVPTTAALKLHRQDSTPQQIEIDYQRLKNLKAEMLQSQQTPQFSYTPGNLELPKLTTLPPPNLNTEQAQASINSLGTAAQENSNSLQAAQTAAQTTATAFQSTDAATQGFNFALQGTNSSALQLSNSFLQNNSAVAQNAAALNVSNSALAQNSASVLENAGAMSNSVGSITAMSGAASDSTGAISSLASSSAGASGSISGLGAAAQSAISSLLSAGASAAASIGSAVGNAVARLNISQNAKGGIYNHGAFLTWFAEKSPEAAIPLDGSDRAINLWQTAGQLLGVYPAENYNGGIYKNGGQSISISKLSNSGSTTDLTFHIESLDALSKSTQSFAQVTKNIVATEKQPSLLERIFTPSTTRAQKSMDAQLKMQRAKLPAQVKNSKSYEALNKPTATNAPQAITAPQQWSFKGLIQKILSGNITGALETAGKMQSRKIEIDNWEKQNPPVKTIPAPVMHAAESQQQAQKKRGGIAGFFDKFFGHREPQRDELGNITTLKGNPENKITADDDNLVVASKKAAQEKEYRVQKRRHTQKTILNVLGGIGGAIGLNKIFGKDQRGKEKIFTTLLTPTLGKIFGTSQSKTQPQLTKNIVASGSQPSLLERIFTPSTTRAQQSMDAQLKMQRAKLPAQVKASKSYESLNKPTATNAPQAITAPQQWSFKGLIQKILSGNITGALETAGKMQSRKIEIDEWEKNNPQAKKSPQFPIPVLHAQAETLKAQNSGGEFSQFQKETPITGNEFSAAPTVNLTFTINIQGNANAQDVENGVKSTIPMIQDSLESQWKKFAHERARRGFL